MINLLHITDSHLLADAEGELHGMCPRRSLQTVLDHVRASGRRPDYILATGDLTQDATHAAYQRFMAMIAELAAPVSALPGNHDQTQQLRRSLGDAAKPVVDRGHWRIILLDSSVAGSAGGHLAPDQLALLERAAQVGPGRHVLVALHHQPVAVGSDWLDTMQVDNSAALLDCLARTSAVRALVWGHIHQQYDDVVRLRDVPVERPPLQLMATPATCFQFKPDSDDFALDRMAPGYRWLILHDDGHIDTNVVRIVDDPLVTPATNRF